MSERTFLQRQIADSAARLQSADRIADRLSWSRVVYFALAVIALIVFRPREAWPLIPAAIPFAVLVWLHRRASNRADRARGALAAARGSLARVDREWAEMPPLQSVSTTELPNRPAIRDLDIYGERSLFRLLDVSQPVLGGALTLRWLLEDPATLAVIRARQDSVATLRTQPDFLLECARLCRHGSRPAPANSKLFAFRDWCETRVDRFSPKLVGVARVLTVTFIGLLLLIIIRPTLLQPLASSLMIVLAGQFIIAALARKYLHRSLREAADLLTELTSVVEVLGAVVANTSTSGRFAEIRQTLSASEAPAAFTRLSRLFAWNTAHHSPMLLAAVNALVAFDAHLASRIDDWREKHGGRISEWLDLVAEAEALVALATMAFENPDATIPSVHDEEAPAIEAEECSHPLIAKGVRVANPVVIESPGSAIVISGSNMSGKTTYLRAVGLNALLAFAGGAVCAKEFSIRRSRVRTTVRVEDDLGAGVSLFLAEVSRIAAVVEDAGKSNEPPVLFLLDEILHGTNAADRREATQLVLRRLLGSDAWGIITTHDPQIAAVHDQVHEARVTAVHFTDAVEAREGGVAMTFDYVLRPGPATTTNALRILEKLGLRADD